MVYSWYIISDQCEEQKALNGLAYLISPSSTNIEAESEWGMYVVPVNLSGQWLCIMSVLSQ